MSDNKLDQTPIAATIAEGRMQAPEGNDAAASTTHESNTRVQPRDGSTLHYATLRMETDARDRLLRTLNLTNTVSASLLGVQEAQVAQTKLQWWNDEIGRLAHNEPRHPATKHCALWFANHQSAQTQLTNILDAATAARFDAPSDDAGWLELVQRDYGARLELIHCALGKTSRIDMNAMALSAAWIDILRTLPSRIHHDQIAFTPSLYQRFDLSRQVLQKHVRVAGRGTSNDKDTNQSALNELLQSAIADALAATDAALSSDSYQTLRKDTNTRALCVWFQLRRVQLALWQSEKPNLMRETMTLTPLRKWFIAFRHR